MSLIGNLNFVILQVLGLMSILEKTMNSFTSQSTKDDMRQLLIAYGKAIVDVIKERQSEINYSNSGANSETSKKINSVPWIELR